MTECDIFSYKNLYFYSQSPVSFDLIEPYSTICSVTVAVPSFIFAFYVYYILMRIKSFRESLFFQLFITKGYIDVFAYLSNLLRYRLPLFGSFTCLFAPISESFWTTLLCSFAVLMPRCQLIGECLISINRLLAIHRPLESPTSQKIFIRVSFFTIFVLPFLATIPDLMTGYQYVGAKGIHNTIILFTSQQAHLLLMFQVSKITSTLFQLAFTVFALACNCGILLSLLSRNGTGSQLKSSSKAGAEYGLALTTLLMFVTHLAYALIMIYYNFSPRMLFVMALTTPSLDLISILPIYLLFVCSKQVRKAVLEGNACDRENNENPPPLTTGWSRTVQFRLRQWRIRPTQIIT